MLQTAQRLVKHPVVAGECGAGINEAGRAMRGNDVGDGDGFGVQHAVLKIEMVHA